MDDLDVPFEKGQKARIVAGEHRGKTAEVLKVSSERLELMTDNDFDVLNLPKVYCVSMEPTTKVHRQPIEVIDGQLKGALGHIVRRSDRSQRVMVELSTPHGSDPVGERIWIEPGQWKHVKPELTRDQRIQAVKDRLVKPDLMVNGDRAVEPPTPAPSRAASKVGRKSLVESLSPEELDEQIQGLLAELRASSDPDDQKRIRRALRLRGHRGGLRN